MTTQQTDAVVPPEVNRRLEIWLRMWRLYAFMHYGLGVAGVLTSTLAAALPKEGSRAVWATVCAIMSAVCFAVMGFVRPEPRYLGFVRAWRALDVARIRFAHHLLSHEELLTAMEQCEVVATEPMKHDLPLEKLGPLFNKS